MRSRLHIILGGRYYDALSDVYHFRMPGHSGSFFRKNDGTFMVFDAGGSGGTYRIEKTNKPRTGEGYQSQITITTGDGYQYVFGDVSGSLQIEDEFLERIWLGKEPSVDKGTIVAWRLREIVSPGGRVLAFHYYDPDNNRAVMGFQDELSHTTTAACWPHSGTRSIIPEPCRRAPSR